MNQQDGVSVVICTYNGAKRLVKTLEYLCKQILPEKFNWEIIIVDNNSTDNTLEVCQTFKEKHSEKIHSQVIQEINQGLSYARKKGIEKAQFEYILFCDDDNWLSKDYVYTLYQTLSNVSDDIGIVGGFAEAICETPPPSWFNALKRWYAIPPYEDKSSILSNEAFVSGAGMGMRKSIWNQLKRLNFDFILSDRKGTNLSSGGDFEIQMAARILGYKVYFSNQLFFKHYIPKRRLTWEYFTNIRDSGVSTRVVLAAYAHHLSVYPNSFFFYFLWIMKNTFIHSFHSIFKLFSRNEAEKQAAIQFFLFLKYLYFHSREYIVARIKIKKWTQANH